MSFAIVAPHPAISGTSMFVLRQYNQGNFPTLFGKLLNDITYSDFGAIALASRDIFSPVYDTTPLPLCHSLATQLAIINDAHYAFVFVVITLKPVLPESLAFSIRWIGNVLPSTPIPNHMSLFLSPTTFFYFCLVCM